VICVSPEAVLVRFLSEGGADPWTIIFWTRLFSLPVSAGYAIYEAGGLAALWQSVAASRWYYAAAIPVQSSKDIAFTLSFLYTSAANALLLINLNSLWCALLGRFFLGDILQKRTYIALVLALCCLLIIFLPDVVQRKLHDRELVEEVAATEGSEVKGNIISLITGLLLAVYIAIARKGGKSSKNVNLTGAVSLGSLLSCIISLCVTRGHVLPASYWTVGRWKFWLASSGLGFCFGAIFVTMTIAARFIKGAEIGIALLLEVILGPLFVFAAYGDVPSKWTLIGGSLLLSVLAIHESRPLFEKAQDVRRSLSSRKLSIIMGSMVTRASTVGSPEIFAEIEEGINTCHKYQYPESRC